MKNYAVDSVKRKSEVFQKKIKKLHEKTRIPEYQGCTEYHFSQMRYTGSGKTYKRTVEPIECYKCGWGKKEEEINVGN